MRNVHTSSLTLTVGFKGLVNTRDRSVTDMAYAKDACGFRFEKGVLTGHMGLTKATKPTSRNLSERSEYPPLPPAKAPKALFVYRKSGETDAEEELVVQCEDGSILSTPIYLDGEWKEYGVKRDGRMEGVNMIADGGPCLMLTSDENDLVVIFPDNAYVMKQAPRFSTIDVYNERLYGGLNGEECKLWFSDDFDPGNWKVSPEEAGYITFNDDCGKILKCVNMHGYLYIFREYSIFKLTAYGAQSEFSLKRMISDTGKIFADTIALCGGNIIFLCEKGLFSFDGFDVKEIGYELPPVYGGSDFSAAYSNGAYYLACSEKGGENNMLIRYDMQENTISAIRDVNIVDMLTMNTRIGSEVLAVLKQADGATICRMCEDGRVLGVPTRKYYESPTVNLDVSALKTVKSVSLITSRPLTLTVCVDMKEYDFKLDGSEKIQTVFVDKCGRKIAFKLSSEHADAYVTPLEVKIDRLGI